MTDNRQRYLADFPHMASVVETKAWAAKLADNYTGRKPPQQNYALCLHRGKLLDTTACQCNVWACKVHGTCSTSKRAGVNLCQNCTDFQPHNRIESHEK